MRPLYENKFSHQIIGFLIYVNLLSKTSTLLEDYDKFNLVIG